MNTEKFIGEQHRYFEGSYEEFCSFGGPSLYFYEECIRAGRESFLSKRHIEMLYATLAAWGMHRMGDPNRTKTKLTNWSSFSESILTQSDALQEFSNFSMLTMSSSEYADAVLKLEPIYRQFKLSVSNATIVVNSKTLFHLFPEFIPPIDRQYTIRFFTHKSEQWRDKAGRFKAVNLPIKLDEQFELFRKICTSMKDIIDRTQADILAEQHRLYRVSAPKALDNAIVNFVKIESEQNR